MSDEAKLRQQAERGERAARLLENDLLQEFFEAYEQKILNTFRASSINDDKGHRNCRMHLDVLAEFREHLERYVHQGQFARKQLFRLGKRNNGST